ncbi:MAG: transcription termination factor NusA [Candidatus Shapirobacteria bacterium]|jgi:N utilization substance protein A
MDLKKLPKTEFAAAVAQIAGERNIDVQLILDSIELGLISAYKRDQKEHGTIIDEETKFEAELSPETGSFKIVEVDDDKRKDVTPPGFGRIAAQTAKQVIDQSIHEAEKETILTEYRKKIGALISGTILKIDGFKQTVGVGRIEAICPREEQVKAEDLAVGDKKLFLIKDIIKDESGRSDIILSRRDPEFIKQLFAREVPEVGNRSVIVEKIARNAGVRTKVAVSSKEAGIDPIGSCIGQKGSRVQSILGELSHEEKVDVIQFSKNLSQFIAQALSPAEGVKVVSVENGTAFVTVPENQLALAIGSGGDNVHLAGILAGVEIKVQAEKT